jgi:hypothetical protein
MPADEDEDESRQAGLLRRRVKLFSRNKTSGMLVVMIIRTTKKRKNTLLRAPRTLIYRKTND